MEIQVDKRSIRAHREPAAERCIAEGLPQLRDLQIRLARSLARIDDSAHFVFSGCASVVEYAVKLGYSAYEARTLTNLGKTLVAAPEAKERVRRSEITIEAAAAVGRILAHPELVRAGDDWLHAAAVEPMRALRKKIRERMELHTQGESGIEEVTVHVASHVRDNFTRAREVASQKEGKPLTEGQTFHRVVDFYLEKNDPLRKPGGKRRVGPTVERPVSRYVPVEVVRAVWKRAQARCEVPGCDHALKLQLAHRSPHCEGSGRELGDLGLLCPRHHVLYDAGKISWPVSSLPVSSLPVSSLPVSDLPGSDFPDSGVGSASEVRERAPPVRTSRDETCSRRAIREAGSRRSDARDRVRAQGMVMGYSSNLNDTFSFVR